MTAWWTPRRRNKATFRASLSIKPPQLRAWSAKSTNLGPFTVSNCKEIRKPKKMLTATQRCPRNGLSSLINRSLNSSGAVTRLSSSEKKSRNARLTWQSCRMKGIRGRWLLRIKKIDWPRVRSIWRPKNVNLWTSASNLRKQTRLKSCPSDKYKT